MAELAQERWQLPVEIDLAGYQLEDEYRDHPEYPIKFYKNTNGERVVSILDEYNVPVPNPEKFPPEIRKDITDWSVAEKQVMLGEAELNLLIKIARRLAGAGNVVIEGPAAVSKSYVGGWIASALFGWPYFSTTFGPSTEGEDIFGGPTKLPPRFVEPLGELLQRAEISGESANENIKSIAQVLKQQLEIGGEEAVKVFDVRRLSVALGLGPDGLFLLDEIGWEDSALMTKIMQGYYVCMDELNRTRFMNLLTDIFDPHRNTISIPGRKGAVDKSRAFIVGTQNTSAYAGAEETPQHIASRERMVRVGENDLQFYKNLYGFFTKGDNPKFIHGGKEFCWKQDIKTDFRDQLEQLGDQRLGRVIAALSTLHMTLNGMVDQRQLGKVKKEGGNYVFDQRDIRSLLKSIKKSLSGYAATAGENNDLKQVTNWEIVIKEALYEVYADGAQMADQIVIRDLIDNMPIWDELDEGTKPDWAQGSKRIKVKKSKEGWEIGNIALDTEEAKPTTIIINIKAVEEKWQTLTQAWFDAMVQSNEIIIGDVANADGQVSTENFSITTNGYWGEQFVSTITKQAVTAEQATDTARAKLARVTRGVFVG